MERYHRSRRRAGSPRPSLGGHDFGSVSGCPPRGTGTSVAFRRFRSSTPLPASPSCPRSLPPSRASASSSRLRFSRGPSAGRRAATAVELDGRSGPSGRNSRRSTAGGCLHARGGASNGAAARRAAAGAERRERSSRTSIQTTGTAGTSAALGMLSWTRSVSSANSPKKTS